MKIEIATPVDYEGMLHIYNAYIEQTVITFECEKLALSDFTKRIQSIQEDYPCLVAKQDGKVIAYAYAHRMFERAAYQWDAELSVYCAPGCIQQGCGTLLLDILLKILKEMGILNVYSLVTRPNIGSERLHQRFAFQEAGVYHKTGYKHGAWHDVTIFEKALAAYPSNPTPVMKFPMLDQRIVEALQSKDHSYK